MALARLALENLQQIRVSSSLLSPHYSNCTLRTVPKQRWDSEILRRFSTSTSTSENVHVEKSDGRDITVSENGDGKKSKLASRKQRKMGLWSNDARDFVPALHGIPLSLPKLIAWLFANLSLSRLLGRVKEDDKCYKLRYEVPGLTKEELKITVEDGFLVIKGEHKEEEGSDDEQWSSYGYYNTTLMLPVDAKVDEIKAEMKDGVLTITIPRTESQGRDVKEVEIQ
ncbi:hypothetical protein HHK36_021455 [Tetracentron sinense]|uniref:SHSP domain-containing protein n=1 Tax=Tetracentron sinense TaxID=13715 RepID=A0A835DAN5_TETSI|nr:hypothetical protein HHK36_021455 [Tetracentron sinense]